MKYTEATKIGWVALGGMCGALLRHGTNMVFGILASDSHFITATTIENLLGSFLMGVLFTVLSRRPDKNVRLNLFLLTGLLGSYTTYSGFMTEAYFFFAESVLVFAAYLFSQVFAGILFLLIAVKITNKLIAD
jgi:fluoride exporter